MAIQVKVFQCIQFNKDHIGEFEKEINGWIESLPPTTDILTRETFSNSGFVGHQFVTVTTLLVWYKQFSE